MSIPSDSSQPFGRADEPGADPPLPQGRVHGQAVDPALAAVVGREDGPDDPAPLPFLGHEETDVRLVDLLGDILAAVPAPGLQGQAAVGPELHDPVVVVRPEFPDLDAFGSSVVRHRRSPFRRPSSLSSALPDRIRLSGRTATKTPMATAAAASPVDDGAGQDFFWMLRAARTKPRDGPERAATA